MAARQLLPWLPVSCYHMAAAVLMLLCCPASRSPKEQYCPQLDHLLPCAIGFFAAFALAPPDSAQLWLSNKKTTFS